MIRTLLVLACTAGVALAQTPNPNQAEADKYFAEGRDLLVNKKDAKGACIAFEKAIQLDPTAPGVMLNLGLCYETQGKFATSLYWFRKAQFAAAEAKPAPLTEYEDAAKQHTQDLSGKVALAKIDTTGAPPGVRISVDGRPVRQEDYSRLEVDSDSVIEARAPGKQVFKQTVEIVSGRDAKEIKIVMLDEVEAPMRDPGKRRRQLAWIVGGGGVVLWGVTLAYGLRVRDRYETDGGAYDGPDGYKNAKDDLRYKGTALFLAGTAAVGACIVLLITAPKPYREKAQETSFMPIVSPDQVGFGLSRAF